MFKKIFVVLIIIILFTTGCIHKGDTETFDIRVPSIAAGNDGTLAVRVISPTFGNERYKEGAPVIIFMQGGYEVKGIGHSLPNTVDDIIIVTFIYPGGIDPWSNISSDGVYDWRGENCIKALRDVILFCTGMLKDSEGRNIDEIIPASVLHDNIGLIGISNGGNIISAVSAIYGDLFAENLRYIIQWETPVNSQIACRDLGRVVLDWTTGIRGDYENPYYLNYQYPFLEVDYSNLAYNNTLSRFQIFHDGNNDGEYTTILGGQGVQTPDLNNNDKIDIGEDYPVGNYSDGNKYIYSREITMGLAEHDVFNGEWPEDIANVSEANRYWNLRESVVLYNRIVEKIPNIETMILASVDDHVQIEDTKPHVRLAFDGWKTANANWIKINPDRSFLIKADPRLAKHNDLPNTKPNLPPSNWTDHQSYCYPDDIYDGTVQLAAIYQMADRAQRKSDN
jgi:hypothetical protein